MGPLLLGLGSKAPGQVSLLQPAYLLPTALGPSTSYHVPSLAASVQMGDQGGSWTALGDRVWCISNPLLGCLVGMRRCPRYGLGS